MKLAVKESQGVTIHWTGLLSYYTGVPDYCTGVLEYHIGVPNYCTGVLDWTTGLWHFPFLDNVLCIFKKTYIL